MWVWFCQCINQYVCVQVYINGSDLLLTYWPLFCWFLKRSVIFLVKFLNFFFLFEFSTIKKWWNTTTNCQQMSSAKHHFTHSHKRDKEAPKHIHKKRRKERKKHTRRWGSWVFLGGINILKPCIHHIISWLQIHFKDNK